MPHHPAIRRLGRIPRAELLAAALVIGCGGDRSVAAPTEKPPSVMPPEGASLSLVPAAGDGQRGEAGAELPIPVSVRVLAPGGLPARGVHVAFAASDASLVDPAEAVTGDDGIARAQWTLGARSGDYSVDAKATNAEPAHFRATATPPLDAGELRPLDIRTYDGSGEVVHPDAVRVPRRWSLGQRYLAITPYQNGNSAFEMPSVFTAGDASQWQEPPGGTNPVVRPSGGGYLSDPDMLFEPDRRELWMYYRGVNSDNTIYLIRSSDGVSWTPAATVVRAPKHQVVSPAVVRVGPGSWHMWSVNSGPQGCSGSSTTVEHRTSTNGTAWSSPRTVRLADDPALMAWHIDVEWVPELHEFWAVYNVKTAGTCATPALYLATSPDGVSWTTYPSPLLERGAISEFEDIVYRSSIDYSAPADMVTIWYSGARFFGEGRWVWRAAVQRLPRAAMLRTVQRPASGASLLPRPGVPPLLRAP